MEIFRKYKRLLWFELVELVEESLSKKTDFESYIEYIDELKMRLVDSISEGLSYKVKGLAVKISNSFEIRTKEDEGFASSDQQEEFRRLLKDLLEF